MRISTSQLFDVGSNNLSKQQSELFRLQQQISSGRRIQTPSDDPIAASAVLTEKQSESINQQFQRNIGNARHQIGLAENVVNQIVNVVQDARQFLVQAGNTTLTDADRASITTSLGRHLEQILALANSDDGNGQYLFSGYQTSTMPYARTAAGATYNGDSGQPLLQIQSNRYIELSNTGNEIFELSPTGNGTFATSISDPAAATPVTNTGTGIIDNGSVLVPSGYAGETFIIAFTSASTYDVIQRAAGVETTLSTGNSYTSGAAITLASGAIQISISGAPASGDRFVIEPSANQNIFITLQSIIDTLNTPVTGSTERAQLIDGIRQALTNVDQGMEKLLSAQSSMGTRLQELDTMEGVNGALQLQHTQRISQLEDLDYAKAVSDLARNQFSLQAAQNTFVQVTKLSLFDYLT